MASRINENAFRFIRSELLVYVMIAHYNVTSINFEVCGSDCYLYAGTLFPHLRNITKLAVKHFCLLHIMNFQFHSIYELNIFSNYYYRPWHRGGAICKKNCKRPETSSSFCHTDCSVHSSIYKNFDFLYLHLLVDYAFFVSTKHTIGFAWGVVCFQMTRKANCIVIFTENKENKDP